MGYRSQVAIVFQVEDFEEKLGKEPKDVQDLVRDLISNADDDEELLSNNGKNHYRLLHWQDIKWYEEYVAVGWMDDYRVEAPETTSFIRLGEDAEDFVEETGDAEDCPFHLRWNRGINW